MAHGEQFSVGDLCEAKIDVATTPFMPDEPTEFVRRSSRYRIIEIVGNGVDLRKEAGEGPENLRILRSAIETVFHKVQGNF